MNWFGEDLVFSIHLRSEVAPSSYIYIVLKNGNNTNKTICGQDTSFFCFTFFAPFDVVKVEKPVNIVNDNRLFENDIFIRSLRLARRDQLEYQQIFSIVTLDTKPRSIM